MLRVLNVHFVLAKLCFFYKNTTKKKKKSHDGGKKPPTSSPYRNERENIVRVTASPSRGPSAP